ncbi:MAG: phosphonate ABC transporter, permease protein PhnE [Caldimonas sp.]|nr:phosphonate ABC transporter, permease protein PhnE [Pseudomonadota bacterium]
MTSAAWRDPARTETRPSFAGIATLALVLVAIAASFAYLAVDYRQLFSGESMHLMAKFIAEFFPPDLSAAFVAKAAWGALQTFAVAAIGTLLAVVAGGALAFPAAGRFGLTGRLIARFILNFLRSVPELVWAALMVIAAGLGPFAGTLALALHTTGVLGRLYAESLENVPALPERALREAGSGRVAAFAYATLPLLTTQGIAYALYRLEMNIRMAAVLGFVGAGGLGQLLYFYLSIFQQAQAATLLIAMFLLVFAVDSFSAALRARLAPAHG